LVLAHLSENPNFFAASTLDKPKGYRVLLIISMFYMSIMLCNAILTNRYIGTDALFVLGGTFTSPLVFILDDIIAEIYGYRITQSVILTGYIAQTFFALVCAVVLITPSPSFFQEQHAYATILGNSLLWIDLSGFFAYITANLLNTYILTRWKVLLKGRKFWLRSIGSSIFSEAFYSFLAILIMEFKSVSLDNIFKIVALSFGIKVIYCLIFAFPGNFLVAKLKKITGIDVYDLSPKYTPFKYLSKRFGYKHAG
jgi:queuosine precursor transporter